MSAAAMASSAASCSISTSGSAAYERPKMARRQPSRFVRSAGPALDRQRECQSDRDAEEGEAAATTQILRITS